MLIKLASWNRGSEKVSVWRHLSQPAFQNHSPSLKCLVVWLPKSQKAQTQKPHFGQQFLLQQQHWMYLISCPPFPRALRVHCQRTYWRLPIVMWKKIWSKWIQTRVLNLVSIRTSWGCSVSGQPPMTYGLQLQKTAGISLWR